MLKFGICTLADLDATGASGPASGDSTAAQGSSGFLGNRKFVAVSLYRAVAESERADRDALLERILVRFPTRNSTLKRTTSRRFEDFDSAIAELVREHCQPGSENGAEKAWRVHDAAVSDGRTAADFFELLDGIEGFEFRFLASDYAPDVELVADATSRLEVACDPVTRTPLQVVWPPFVFNLQQGESPLLYPLNHLVRAWLMRGRVPDLLDRAERGEGTKPPQHVWLLHPRCLRLRESDPRFRFERRDLLAAETERFDLVRAMNVLNRSYFPEEQLGRAVEHVAASLEPGGLFITGSNADAGSTVHGAVYRRTARGFERLFVSGDGSPVDALVAATQVAVPR